MVEALSYGTVNGHVGLASMALAWTAFGLTVTAMVGLLVMILSVWVLFEAFGAIETVRDTGGEDLQGSSITDNSRVNNGSIRRGYAGRE